MEPNTTYKFRCATCKMEFTGRVGPSGIHVTCPHCHRVNHAQSNVVTEVTPHKKWLTDTGAVEIPCMNPECLAKFDVTLYPSTETTNLYMGSCPDCYMGYRLEIYPGGGHCGPYGEKL